MKLFVNLFYFYLCLYFEEKMVIFMKYFRQQFLNILTILQQEQNNKIKQHIITFHSMKQHQIITKTASSDLQQILNPDAYNALKQKLIQQSNRKTISSKCTGIQSTDIRTPSTIDTALRKRGSAISKSKRPLSRSKNKISMNMISTTNTSEQFNKNILTATNTSFFDRNAQDKEKSVKDQTNSQTGTLNRKVLTDRAVYYGNVQLPYLHSSDAISCLYQRPKANAQANPQALINPPPSTSSYLLTNLKNLYLYYTSLDTLRQLGTGWSNLKSLTIMCSYQLRDLSGLSIFPSLQYLFVPHNNISQISDIMYHSSLRCVDLQDNQIDLIQQIQYIYTIANLEWVDISHNPITKQKQKYRIIAQNLGNKLQIEEVDKVFEYELKQIQQYHQLLSYENLQASNNLVKEINQQIIKEQIKVGEVWRISQARKTDVQWVQPTNQPDLEIITPYEEENSEDWNEEDEQNQKNIQELGLRVTPLTEYIQPELNLDPLKKYFNNKVCPQSKAEGRTQKIKLKIQNKESQRVQTEEQSSMNTIEPRNKKFSATQTLKHPLSFEQKPRLSSVSLKKRLGKLSISKSNSLASTCQPSFSVPRQKQSYINEITPPAPGLKFLAKRKLLARTSNQLLTTK